MKVPRGKPTSNRPFNPVVDEGDHAIVVRQHGGVLILQIHQARQRRPEHVRVEEANLEILLTWGTNAKSARDHSHLTASGKPEPAGRTGSTARSPRARLTAVVDFPTPPLAEETSTTCFTPGMGHFLGSPFALVDVPWPREQSTPWASA